MVDKRSSRRKIDDASSCKSLSSFAKMAKSDAERSDNESSFIENKDDSHSSSEEISKGDENKHLLRPNSRNERMRIKAANRKMSVPSVSEFSGEEAVLGSGDISIKHH